MIAYDERAGTGAVIIIDVNIGILQIHEISRALGHVADAGTVLIFMIAIIVIPKGGAKTNRFPAGIGDRAVYKEQTSYFEDSHQYHHKNG